MRNRRGGGGGDAMNCPHPLPIKEVKSISSPPSTTIKSWLTFDKHALSLLANCHDVSKMSFRHSGENVTHWNFETCLKNNSSLEWSRSSQTPYMWLKINKALSSTFRHLLVLSTHWSGSPTASATWFKFSKPKLRQRKGERPFSQITLTVDKPFATLPWLIAGVLSTELQLGYN